MPWRTDETARTSAQCRMERMTMNRHIILIGYMGSGKTSVGQILSEKLGLPLLDTDAMIVEERGMSVNDIFASRGEAFFRLLESELLERIAGMEEPVVLSTGGGLPMTPQNREPLRNLGMVVYLQAEPEEILRRLEHDDTRPLLAQGDRGEKIRSMLDIRGPVYRETAAHTVRTDGKTCAQIADEIIKLYRMEDDSHESIGY